MFDNYFYIIIHKEKFHKLVSNYFKNFLKIDKKIIRQDFNFFSSILTFYFLIYLKNISYCKWKVDNMPLKYNSMVRRWATDMKNLEFEFYYNNFFKMIINKKYLKTHIQKKNKKKKFTRILDMLN